MLTIRKRNFESEECFCCTGLKKYKNDPESAIVYQLYHKLPGGEEYLPARVIVPRCKHCADKMKPIRTLTIITAVIGAIAGLLYCMSSHGLLISIVGSIVWGVVLYFTMPILYHFAFNIVYNQMCSNYNIISIMEYEYGWQTSEPKNGDSDDSFTEVRMNQMLQKLSEQYDCEFGDL